MRRIGDQQLNVEMQIGNLLKVSLQHRTIAKQTEAPTVVAHVVMDEPFQLRPVLLIEAGNVSSVDFVEIGFDHENFSRAYDLACPRRSLADAEPGRRLAPLTRYGLAGSSRSASAARRKAAPKASISAGGRSETAM